MAKQSSKTVHAEIRAVERHDPEMAFILDVYWRLGQEEPVSEGELERAISIIDSRIGFETFRGKKYDNRVALDVYMASIHQGVLVEELTTPETRESVVKILDMLAGGVTAGSAWREWIRYPRISAEASEDDPARQAGGTSRKSSGV